MEKVKHELRLDGTIQQGFSLVAAVEELTKLFKDKTEWFQPLLDGQPVSRPIFITPENAEKLQKFLTTIGLQGQVSPPVTAAGAPSNKLSSGRTMDEPRSADTPVDLVAMAGMNVTDTAANPNPFIDAPADNSNVNEIAAGDQQIVNDGLTLQLEPMDVATADQPESAAGLDHGMVCPKCGVEQAPTEQCNACGIFFAKYRAQMERSSANELDGTTARHTDSIDEGSTLEEDMLDFVRDNGYYYDGKFNAIRDAGDKFKPGWHWPGFFFPFHWALYRKLWLWAAALLIVPIILAPVTWFFSFIFIHAIFAMSANFIYYKHVKNEVSKLRNRRKANAETLAKAGGISWPAVVAGLVLPLVFGGMLMSWMMPDGLKGYQEVKSSLEAQDPKLMKTRQGQETFMNMTMAKLTIAVMMQQDKIKPHDVNYDSLVAEGLPANNLIDGWGTPFRISTEGGKVFIVSAGPDRDFDSSDDIGL